MNLELYQKLDQLIEKGYTGGPEQLARQLGVSERSVKQMIFVLKEDCGAPVRYDRKHRTYYYAEPGRCIFKFSPCIKENLTLAFQDIITKILPLISIALNMYE